MVKFPDAYLTTVNDDEQVYYNQFNKIQHLKYVVVVNRDGKGLGCTAINEYQDGVMEVKRNYDDTNLRGNGIGKMI